MTEKHPPARDPADRERRSDAYEENPDEVVQINEFDSTPVTGGGHVVKEEPIKEEKEGPQYPSRFALILAVVVIGAIFALMVLFMTGALATQAITALGGDLWWLWLVLLAVVVFFLVITAYKMARTNL